MAAEAFIFSWQKIGITLKNYLPISQLDEEGSSIFSFRIIIQKLAYAIQEV